MREKLYAAINDAIDSVKEITLIMSNGSCCCNFCFIPQSVDIDEVEFIIYTGNSFITVNANTVSYNNIDNVYVISGETDEVLIAC